MSLFIELIFILLLLIIFANFMPFTGRICLFCYLYFTKAMQISIFYENIMQIYYLYFVSEQI